MPAPYEITRDKTPPGEPEVLRLMWEGRLTRPKFDDPTHALGYAGALLMGRRQPDYVQ